jgi:hypothetical protein
VIVVSTPTGFITGGRASLIDNAGPLKAWAERHVRRDPDIRWIQGNYVEADAPNSNGHIFPLAELEVAQHTLAGKPLNMLHAPQYVLGCFAGAQLVDAQGKDWKPTTDEPSAMFVLPGVGVATAVNTNTTVAMANPYVEAVAGLWHSRFPEEYFEIERAHKEGSLFFSMEAIPEEVSCPTCGVKAAFSGFESDDYCADMQGPTGPKVLHKPVFSGGAIIIPPVRPGWDRADIRTIAQAHERAEEVHAAVAAELPELGSQEWEQIMAGLIALAEGREFKTKERTELADKGAAMPDGSFPIKSEQDLKNAIQAIGRAKPDKRAAVKSHIKKRARALGLTNLLPDGW